MFPLIVFGVAALVRVTVAASLWTLPLVRTPKLDSAEYLAWAQRHSYPSAFVLRALTQAHDLTQDESRSVLLDIGWPEALYLILHPGGK